MQPLTSSLNVAELSALLQLSPAVIDALVDSGRLLCHVKNGEVRVPLTQVEALFRDALMALYRAEASQSMGDSVVLPAEPRLSEPLDEPDAPLREPLDESDVAVLRESIASVEEARAEPESAAAPTESRGALTLVQASERRPDPPELRMAPRYIPLRQISGIFGDAKFTIVQMSATGLRIRHREPLLPGDEAKISFALMRPARSFLMRARVVWTSLAKSGEDHFSISGLRIIEFGDRLARAIELLDAAHELQPERRQRPRRSNDSLIALSGISDDEIALVTTAMQKFANDPVEASRGYSRARFALADEQVRRLAPPRPRDREEVLGIWEYLERQVDLAKVAGVVSWANGRGEG